MITPESMTDDITAPVAITASTELLHQMRDKWSPPVQVRIHLGHMGWEMTFRTHDCLECTCHDVRTIADDGPVLLTGKSPCPVHTDLHATPHYPA